MQVELEQALRENERLTERYLAAEQQVSDLAALYVAVNRLHGATDLPALVAAVSEIVANMVGSEEMALFETDARHDHIRLVAAAGVAAFRFEAVEIGSGIIGTVAETGRPYVRRDGGSGQSGSDESITACLPLRIGTAVTGVLAIFHLLPHKGSLEERDLDFLEVLSAHVAPAMYLARVYHGGRA
jgi:transcriptional regulator with GAF, ATPase, and Fis domain